jgi:hypothetical protein
MSNHSYSKFKKRILTEQNIASNHIVHLGRILGSADLELLENEKDGTLDMGNWSSDAQAIVQYQDADQVAEAGSWIRFGGWDAP